MFYPNVDAEEFVVTEGLVMNYTRFFVGAVKYLEQLVWYVEPTNGKRSIQGRRGARYAPAAFPLPLPECFAKEPHLKPVFPMDRERNRVYSSDAFDYLCKCVAPELDNRVSRSRRETFTQRLYALACLYRFIEENTDQRHVRVAEWNAMQKVELQERNWSEGQAQALETIRQGLLRSDANNDKQRYLYLSGEPGAGKSEVLVHAAVRAAEEGHRVMVLCPTGTLVHAYRDRLPDTEYISIETIHSGMKIHREADLAKVQYAPPTRLRRIDS